MPEFCKEENMLIVEKIKTRAVKQGLTVAEVEARAKIPPRSIRRWDEHSPSIDKVFAAAQALGCTVDELIAETEA